ncbi:Uncharacterised protein [Salmonella enterica subsp. enterica serovar Bovismorbificans]|uniref:Uncharacterized protein n=1 Tax=Salmonella enterica subsp. enterica serovar Bovismorbificans TaxID=58097 RepID=A0A655C8X9_SALET|nr:Uncharacterised protein [Salmonella enterica subsp. enterica serovar Bovismorbificans]
MILSSDLSACAGALRLNNLAVSVSVSTIILWTFWH